MVTGVEAAGLVLGSIPLILAGLQFYVEGINVTKRFWKYREEIKSLVVELRAENTLYINSINMLLIGVVNQKDMALFLADPKGDRWKEAQFELKLKKRLGNSYVSYLENITLLMKVAEDFTAKLKLSPNGKAQFSDTNAFKEQYKRLKFSLSKSDYKELMDRLKNVNQRLYDMTMQTLHLAAAQQTSDKRKGENVPNFQIIKNKAESFYSALSEAWQCPCHADHSVSLLLEPRNEDIPSEDEDSDEDIMRDPFHVLFRYNHATSPDPSTIHPWIWDEADVQVSRKPQSTTIATATTLATTSTKGVRFAQKEIPKAVHAALGPQPNLQPIKDLCSAISTFQKPQRDVCFSLLADEIAKQKYGVLITPMKQLPTATDAWSVSSLRTILEDPKFAQKERLKLAVILASSILQLHETPWLDDHWGKDSIFFVDRPDKTLYDHPFVSQCFDQTNTIQVPEDPSDRSCVIRNETLYALGIALIELWYRKPIANLHEKSDGPQNTGSILRDTVTEFKTANRLTDALYSEAGAKYSDAVRRCIRCEFDSRASSLEDVRFQKAVYYGVVAQLQENYDFLFQDDMK